MTLPPVSRIFFAIDLPATSKQEIGNFIASLKRNAKTNGIRWTKPECLHITLQFLGEVQTDKLKLIVEEVRKRVQGLISPSTVSLGAVHLFPDPYRPRVIVLDVLSQASLKELALLIGEGVKTVGFNVDSRPFRGHLTLGRIKQPQGVNLKFITQYRVPEFGHIAMDEVVLFRSEPQPEGSKYIPLEKIKLS